MGLLGMTAGRSCQALKDQNSLPCLLTLDHSPGQGVQRHPSKPASTHHPQTRTRWSVLCTKLPAHAAVYCSPVQLPPAAPLGLPPLNLPPVAILGTPPDSPPPDSPPDSPPPRFGLLLELVHASGKQVLQAPSSFATPHGGPDGSCHHAACMLGGALIRCCMRLVHLVSANASCHGSCSARLGMACHAQQAVATGTGQAVRHSQECAAV